MTLLIMVPGCRIAGLPFAGRLQYPKTSNENNPTRPPFYFATLIQQNRGLHTMLAHEFAGIAPQTPPIPPYYFATLIQQNRGLHTMLAHEFAGIAPQNPTHPPNFATLIYAEKCANNDYHKR